MKWNSPVKIEKDVDSELIEYSSLLRQLLFSRGIRSRDAAEDFLRPSFSQLPDPLALHGVEAAAARIEKAIKERERIFIHGDFDVDGISASAILWEYLFRDRGAKALPYIPSRVDEGYGLSEKSLDSILKKGADLVITVDCGIRDYELIEKFRRSRKNPDGVDIIVTDHHELAKKIPGSVAVVHPFHPEGSYPYKYLSGAAVVWTMIAGMEQLRSQKAFRWQDIPGLDLVAFSTVCDLMPLSSVNRVLVRYGLEAIQSSQRVGLKKLIGEACLVQKDIDTYHLGFVLGPRINAAGRIGDAMDALRLLTTQKGNVAGTLAAKLDELNRERQELTDLVLEEARKLIEEDGTGNHLYFASKDDWPAGIIGLVAGKLQEQYNRPVVLVARNGSDSRGTARSISGFDIVDAISRNEELLIKYGGHSLAAGFTISENNIKELKKSLQKLAVDILKKEHFISEVTADAVVDAGDLTWEALEEIEKLKPFGYGNRNPVFWVRDAEIHKVSALGSGKHMRIVVKGKTGDILSCVFFNGAEGWLDRLAVGDQIDMIGNLDRNIWNGEEYLQFKVKDLRLPGGNR